MTGRNYGPPRSTRSLLIPLAVAAMLMAAFAGAAAVTPDAAMPARLVAMGGPGAGAGAGGGGGGGGPGSAGGPRGGGVDMGHQTGRDSDRTRRDDTQGRRARDQDQLRARLRDMDRLRDRIHRAQDVTERSRLMNEYRDRIQEGMRALQRMQGPGPDAPDRARIGYMQQRQEQMERLMRHTWEYHERQGESRP